MISFQIPPYPSQAKLEQKMQDQANWDSFKSQTLNTLLDTLHLWWSGFQVTIVKPISSKKLLRPITTGENNAMNQSEFLTTTCNLRKARDSKIARVGLVLVVVLLLIGWKTDERF